VYEKGTDSYNLVAVPKWRLHEMGIYLEETFEAPSSVGAL
jgi:hypothetical protein